MKTLFTRMFFVFVISMTTAGVKAQVDITDSLALLAFITAQPVLNGTLIQTGR
jgi:hypothetical protein